MKTTAVKQTAQTAAPAAQTMPDIISFRQMLRSFKIGKSKDNAVFARVFAQDMEAVIKAWKAEADEVLYNLKDNAKVYATDAAGSTWAVMFVPQNQKEYDDTAELTRLADKLNDAQMAYEEALNRTNFKMVAKGKGYSYKVTNPTPAK